MATVEWMRDRLEQAARDGEVVKLTGPRSISDPGVRICSDCAASGHPDGFCCCDEPGCDHNWSSAECAHGRKHFCLPCVEAGEWSPGEMR